MKAIGKEKFYKKRFISEYNQKALLKKLDYMSRDSDEEIFLKHTLRKIKSG